MMNKFSDTRFTAPIIQLDRNLINKIAAGEVVERPASVIKELVENAIDAGAERIDIIARKAGTSYIAVIDDGCGIKKDNISLAFSRHATSKIKDVEDLFAVRSFGFRGEALPSIASVAHLKLTSRHFSEDEGTEIAFEGGREISRRPVAAPVGTKVEVSHLFFNTPARRKFLKAETTESRQIIRIAERMALGKPSTALVLNLNEREVFNLPAGQAIAQRMAALFGVKVDGIVEYDVELGGVSFMVYLAHPDLARHDRTRICLFINGRSVASSSIIHAVTLGYGEFLPKGKFPLAAVYLTVDPAQLDVNVHPTKSEVRLSEERAIHDNLYRIIKKALRDWKMVPVESSDYRAARPSEFSGGARSGDEQIPGKHRGLFDTPHYRAQQPAAVYSPPQINSRVKFNDAPACDVSVPVNDEAMARPQAVMPEVLNEDDIEYLGKSGRTYLVITIRGELYVVDQHAAHERVLYEDALETVEKGSAATQTMLLPETVELSAEEYMVYEEGQEALQKLGFDVAPFGQNAVVINGTPPVFRDKSPTRIMRKMLDDIGELKKAGGDLIKSVAQSMACRAAVMAGDSLSKDEVRALILKLFTVNNPYCCPHGRPTFIKISQEELDGRFGRT